MVANKQHKRTVASVLAAFFLPAALWGGGAVGDKPAGMIMEGAGARALQEGNPARGEVVDPSRLREMGLEGVESGDAVRVTPLRLYSVEHPGTGQSKLLRVDGKGRVRAVEQPAEFLKRHEGASAGMLETGRALDKASPKLDKSSPLLDKSSPLLDRKQ